VAKDAVSLDLSDFDAVGIAGAVVDVVRSQAITRGVNVAATVSAPSGWHRVVVTGRQSGHAVLSVRYSSLTTSRRHNLDDALAKRGWDLDEDNEGATYRIPPGTEPAIAAFELLAVLTLAGAPVDVRQVTATDATGTPVPLH
jgi:hypothetical protein